MAPKLKAVPLPEKSPSVYAEEEVEEEEEEEEEEGSDSSASSTPPPPLQPKPLFTKNPSLPNSNGRPRPRSESSTESESESNPDPLPTAPTKKVPSPETSEASTESDTKAPAAKPIASKPATEPVRPKRPAPGPGPGPGPDTEKPAKRKRPVAPDTPSADKQTKDDDDEIVILEGMLEYFDKDSDPFTDVAGFHEFIKRSRNLDLSLVQVAATIRILKRRYKLNSNKERKGILLFKKENQERVFKLSKRFWGNGTEVYFDKSKQEQAPMKGILKGNSVEPKRAGKSEPKKAEKLEQKSLELVEEGLGDYEFLYSCLIESMGKDVKSSLDMGIIKKGLDLMDSSKKAALEKKWRKLKMMRMKVYTQQAGLVREEMEMIMDAVEGSNS